MTIRLHNLATRLPVETDLHAIATLMRECNTVESEGEATEEEIRTTWHTLGFCLKTDARVITTKQGDIVGYADVSRKSDEQITARACVHPDYRGRGLGTLLVWLIEERARQLLSSMFYDGRITLSYTINHLNQAARRLLENERYTLVRSFWHLAIEMDEGVEHPSSHNNGKLKMAFVVDPHCAVGTMQSARSTGTYCACQYDVYEKELRAAKPRQESLLATTSEVSA